MGNPSSYCAFVATTTSDNVHRHYHDTQYGFPLNDDNALFGRLVLEINQAGLSWTTILNKQTYFVKAYSDFAIDKVARYTDKAKQRLLNDAGIIRNRLKINAAITNAQTILQLQQDHGSFLQWLTQQHSQSLPAWVRLFKHTFTFTGGEITKEFLLSTGFLKGAHQASCPIYQKVLKQQPMWSRP